ncbi:hypothetical protein CAI21_05765 [Alkalilimnicola ehrlichii]|uniref:Pyrrolo-quinoline quinone repeat domain-containing protein n=1 Tax=Alkalilimnicola ehrlichii TaxID=351052 RepID=A0A3E0X0F1_9GAMM|nr:hypothetical protein CAI21_05765 [Alkalilimnicola ehrlichii]RFA38099.1 hypothetical protein CAL65_07135 [Alkalilimnicola ehrlichii]
MRLFLVLLLTGLIVGCATPGRGDPPSSTAFAEQLPIETVWTARMRGIDAADNYRLVPAVRDDVVYAVDGRGRVLAFANEDGERLWRAEVSSHVSAGPGVGARLLVVGTRDGRVYALDRRDGTELWRSRVGSEVLAVPAVADSVVVVRSVDGRVYGLDARNGRAFGCMIVRRRY